jgi:hypothetical protein
MRRKPANGWRRLTRIVAICAVAAPSTAWAGTTVFQPRPSDLWDLDTNYYYTWGMNWNVPTDQQIVGATLTITDIDDWVHPDPDNHLFIHLLDSAAPTSRSVGTASNWVTRGVDWENPSDQFAGQGALIATYVDKGPDVVTLNYTIAQNYLSWLADGNFAFGFDPDCHYYNRGITLTITTAPRLSYAPVPGSTTLCALGLALIVVQQRRWAAKTALHD